MENSEIKKDLNRLYICFSFVVVLMLLISFMYSIVIGIAISPSVYQNLELIETTFGEKNPATMELLELLFGEKTADIFIQSSQVIVYLVTFSISFLVYYFMAIRGKESIKNYCHIKMPEKKGWISDILICYFIMFFTSFVQSQVFAMLEKLGIKIDDLPVEAPKTLEGTIILFIGLCVLPAIFEELIFRGNSIGALKKHGTFSFIFVSSVAFSLMHSRIIQFPYALVGGIAIGYLCIKYNSIIVCMAFHFLSNFLSFFQLILLERGLLLSNIGMIIPFLVAITGMILFNIKIRRKTNINFKKDGLKPSQIVKITLTCEGFYGFLICCIISTAVNIIWA